MTDFLQRRAAAVQASPGDIPNGAARSHAFAAEMRAATIIFNGQERYQVEGYASMVEKRYQMWDMFGTYDEVVSQGAFDQTLSHKPDVAYLTNHRGVTMARTTNGSLELLADSKGLHTLAYLNPKRTDVADLVTAIQDRDVTEMSFAFRIDDGEWNEDYTEYRINAVDLDRGDVSAVNYGASPHTSVAARQSEVLADVQRLPAGAQRAAIAAMQARLKRYENMEPEAGTAAAAATADLGTVADRLAAARPAGRSVALMDKLLQLAG